MLKHKFRKLELKSMSKKNMLKVEKVLKTNMRNFGIFLESSTYYSMYIKIPSKFITLMEILCSLNVNHLWKFFSGWASGTWELHPTKTICQTFFFVWCSSNFKSFVVCRCRYVDSHSFSVFFLSFVFNQIRQMLLAPSQAVKFRQKNFS